ncbi:MAG: 4Fe-4S dicluster domain-containing protein [Bacteroidales bacterium]|nr:4Fe-4S dicluster domain-containing protein [Bacteroidales bacterium]
MKKILLVMLAASLVLGGCKPKTTAVEGTETEVKECCEKKDGECCKKQEGECCKKGEGECCKKHEGQCEKKDGCCEKAEGKECCKNGGGAAAADAAKKGECVKCGKCMPCPVDLDIPKIIDIVARAKKAGKVTPELKKEYEALEHHASECLECGGCERRCASEVEVIKTMQEAVKLFGK